ncbi:unnamed protein product [Dibothriocephalus latus]|uniref:Uncharacterized protein n=1 Tax=Dibothriocephalus latus TaxID=60516 RepID=A0A3P7P0L2_DIBLA|nr:unnamed protein product [Dibothriocephalus latus]
MGSEAQLDPNDPNYIKMLKTAQEFCFCADEELDLSKRFRLLQLRNSGHRDFQEVVVPLNSREIPAGIFEELEPAKEETRKLKTTGLEQHFAERNRYLRDIGNEVLRRFEASIKKKTLDDVVAEEEIPSLIPRRPLNPNRKETKKTSMQNIKETGVVLVVTIGDAKNLPIRAAEQSSRMAGRPAEVSSKFVPRALDTAVIMLDLAGINDVTDYLSTCENERYQSWKAPPILFSSDEDRQPKFQEPLPCLDEWWNQSESGKMEPLCPEKACMDDRPITTAPYAHGSCPVGVRLLANHSRKRLHAEIERIWRSDWLTDRLVRIALPIKFTADLLCDDSLGASILCCLYCSRRRIHITFDKLRSK